MTNLFFDERRFRENPAVANAHGRTADVYCRSWSCRRTIVCPRLRTWH